jgi:hypothetical protein
VVGGFAAGGDSVGMRLACSQHQRLHSYDVLAASALPRPSQLSAPIAEPRADSELPFCETEGGPPE